MKVLFGKKGFKYFLEYKDDDDKIKLLYIMLLRNEWICFDETKYMSFLIKMKNCWKCINKMWDKITNMMQKGFDSEPMYREKYLKTNIKFYKGKIYTNFHNSVPKVGPHCVCLSVILVGSIFKMGKNYYPL